MFRRFSGFLQLIVSWLCSFSSTAGARCQSASAIGKIMHVWPHVSCTSKLTLCGMPKVCGIPQVHFWNLALFVLCVCTLPDGACVLVCAVACASCVRRISQLITCKVAWHTEFLDIATSIFSRVSKTAELHPIPLHPAKPHKL